jgi:hypothetical protein
MRLQKYNNLTQNPLQSHSHHKGLVTNIISSNSSLILYMAQHLMVRSQNLTLSARQSFKLQNPPCLVILQPYGNHRVLVLLSGQLAREAAEYYYSARAESVNQF